MANTIILSLGGSIIIPGEININFLKSFRNLILSYINKGNRAVIVAGGGHVCRVYQNASAKILNPKKPSNLDLDWIGIKATKMNAELVRTIFSKEAYEKVIDNPTKKVNTSKKVIVGSGWLPNCSSDKDAVLLAKTYSAKTVVNLTNIDYVYDKDPRKFKNAKPLKQMSWKQMEKIVGSKWKPGANLPFDPVASKLASRLKLRVIIMNGTNLVNFKNFLAGKKFKGTVIG
ncbi:TPA: UMP kinase [Candidatus Woesearchaeota archaeon]|nr:UMP kinase [Candidatus Woesearchaeota archaeon]